MLLRLLKQLRCYLIELAWLEHKPVSLDSLVQDIRHIVTEHNLVHIQVRMRETYLVDRRYSLTVLVRIDRITTQYHKNR
jgi:hypothetical protein